MYLDPFHYLAPHRNRDFDVGFHSFRPFPISLSRFFDHELESYSRRFEMGEENGVLTLTLELPGFKREDIDIHFERGLLTLVAKNSRDEITQSVNVGSDVDTDKVEATLENGLLKLVLPRLESSKPRKILIK